MMLQLWAALAAAVGAHRAMQRWRTVKLQQVQVALLKPFERLLKCARKSQHNIFPQLKHPQSRALCHHIKGKHAHVIIVVCTDVQSVKIT